MSAEIQLAAALAASGVTALVSTRVYPDVAPQDAALPCVAYSRLGTEVVSTLSAPVVTTRVQLEIWCMAASRAKAEEVADAVQAAIANQNFYPTSRRADFDAEAEVWAAVLSADYWQ